MREINQAHGAPRSTPPMLREMALPAGFAIVAIVLWMSPRLATIPDSPVAQVDPAALIVEARRTAMTDPPQIFVEGRAENCNACHQIFRSAHGGGEPISYHTEIRLEHGMNTRCVNCHDVTNRELLTLRDESTVPYSQTPLLCAQCHGTTYRDWQKGTHGKTLGSWETDSASQRRLSCNECHDPHSPRYAPTEPLPGPNTLRMGAQPDDGGHAPERSPLQRWLHSASNAPDGGGSDSGGHP